MFPTMERSRHGGVGTLASESTSMSSKKLPKTTNEDNYVQEKSSRKEVTNFEQRSKGHRTLSTAFKFEDTIAKYRNMTVKTFKINPTNYSYNWYA